MTRFTDQCMRLAMALGANHDSVHDTIDRCMWPGMPARYQGYVWVIKRNGQHIVLGETFPDALAAATQMGQRRVS